MHVGFIVAIVVVLLILVIVLTVICHHKRRPQEREIVNWTLRSEPSLPTIVEEEEELPPQYEDLPFYPPPSYETLFPFS